MKALGYFATREDIRELQRAESGGMHSYALGLDEFWRRYDPVPGTEINELRNRFEARFLSGCWTFFKGAEESPDDRLVAYVLWGAPTHQETRTLFSRTEIAWHYHPNPIIELYTEREKILRDLAFTISFRVDDNGRYHLARNRVGPPRWKPPRFPLSDTDLDRMRAILKHVDSDDLYRAAIVWRLRADPGPASMAVLLEQDIPSSPMFLRAVAPALHPLKTDLQPIETQPMEEEYLPERNMPAFMIAALKGDESREAYVGSEFQTRWPDSLFVGPLGRARELVDEGLIEEATRLLDEYQGTMSGNPEFWHLKALALLESATPGGRQSSEECARRALRLQPGNLRYRLTLAMILSRRTFDYYADQALDEVIEDAPGAGDAYALKGKIRMDSYWNLEWRASVWATPFHEQLLSGDYQVAEFTELFNRALVAEPRNELASWCLTLHFIVGRRWDDVLRMSAYMLEKGVHTGEAHLARGLALQYRGLLNEALVEYESGFSCLPAEAKYIALNPQWVLKPSEGGALLESTTRDTGYSDLTVADQDSTALRTEASGDANRFWRARDPLFSTPTNERILEQYRRFAFVMWRFAVPNLGLSGWQTHRGRIYLRYGEPLIPGVDPAYDMLESTEDPLVQSSRDIATREWNRASIWDYGEFEVRFQIGFVTGDFRAASPSELRDIAETIPESGEVIGSRNVRDFRLRVFVFEDGDALTLYPVFTLSGELRNTLLRSTRSVGDMVGSFVLLDEEWQRLDVRRVQCGESWTSASPGSAIVVDVFPLSPSELSAAPAYAALEFLPFNENEAWAARDSLRLPTSGSLRLSEPILAYNVIPSAGSTAGPPSGYLPRGEYLVAPQLTSETGPERTHFIFFEVYGLEKDEYGGTSYTITVTVESRNPDVGGFNILDLLTLKRARAVPGEHEISLILERDGIRTDEVVTFQLEMPSNSEAIPAYIVIDAIDKIGNRSAHRILRLSPPG